MLLAMVFIMSFCFATWQVLLNNFVVERASFTGVEIGILQSVREIPGFLAFTAVFVLLILKEQVFAVLSLGVMCLGVAMTGFLPFEYGLYFTTVIMSIGFHYFETMNKSLTLQWLSKEEAPYFLGKSLSVKAVASLAAYASIFVCMELLGVDYVWVYFVIGTIGVIASLLIFQKFPLFQIGVGQKKQLLLKRRYWLYYTLVFLSGARRQIFVVFAGFMMVEKFGYSVADISTLFIVNYLFNFFFASRIGKLIGVIGERRALIFEYTGLICVFLGYAFVENATFAASLYVIDHMFFALAIAVSTYFQKVANQEDIASTASVSFTINHIAAVVIPALLGMVWVVSTKAVFLVGVGFAIASLICSCNIPLKPSKSNAVLWGKRFAGL
ncbi:MFS transporter [Agarilytica rhodophyticola]|uniref:MFS transporter n=1 Tax=Agarilytica rhodophyticola TaxID=1737490 RepID=UPI000B342CF0|nr:MFS transporter [Agarilytica rhodophyticola]